MNDVNNIINQLGSTIDTNKNTLVELIKNNGDFRTNVSSNLTDILRKINSLSEKVIGLRQNNDNLQKCHNEMESIKEEFNKLSSNNQSDKSSILTQLQNLSTKLNEELSTMGSLNTETQNTAIGLLSQIKDLNFAVDTLREGAGINDDNTRGPISPGNGNGANPTNLFKGGYKKKSKRYFSKKGKRRNKKGGWVHESSSSGRRTKKNKNPYSNISSSSSVNKSASSRYSKR
jgi:hypothetical protein